MLFRSQSTQRQATHFGRKGNQQIHVTRFIGIATCHRSEHSQTRDTPSASKGQQLFAMRFYQGMHGAKSIDLPSSEKYAKHSPAFEAKYRSAQMQTRPQCLPLALPIARNKLLDKS